MLKEFDSLLSFGFSLLLAVLAHTICSCACTTSHIGTSASNSSCWLPRPSHRRGTTTASLLAATLASCRRCLTTRTEMICCPLILGVLLQEPQQCSHSLSLHIYSCARCQSAACAFNSAACYCLCARRIRGGSMLAAPYAANSLTHSHTPTCTHPKKREKKTHQAIN